MSVLGPALELARFIEGTVPLQMKRENFFVSGDSWYKFHVAHPWASFEDIWSRREHAYNLRADEAILCRISA